MDEKMNEWKLFETGGTDYSEMTDEEYTAGIYNGTYLNSKTSTGVKDPPAGHWKSQACIATKRMLELTAFLRKIMLPGLS